MTPTRRLTVEECHKLEGQYISNGDTYPLWGFFCDRGLVITRGRTSEEAWEYVKGDFYLNERVECCETLPIQSGQQYSATHAPGWISRPPVWILRKMFEV